MQVENTNNSPKITNQLPVQGSQGLNPVEISIGGDRSGEWVLLPEKVKTIPDGFEDWVFIDPKKTTIDSNDVGKDYSLIRLGGEYALAIPHLSSLALVWSSQALVKTSKTAARAANYVLELANPPNKVAGGAATMLAALPATGWTYMNATPVVYSAIKSSVIALTGESTINNLIASYIAYTSLPTAVPLAATGVGTVAWLLAIVGTNYALRCFYNKDTGEIETEVKKIEDLPDNQKKIAEESNQKMLGSISEEQIEEMGRVLEDRFHLSESLELTAPQELEKNISIENSTIKKIFLVYSSLGKKPLVQERDIVEALKTVVISKEDASIPISEIRECQEWLIRYLDDFRRALEKTSEEKEQVSEEYSQATAALNKMVEEF